MLLTSLLLNEAKKKSRFLMVQIESMVSGHRIVLVRSREDDKIEMIKFDPWIQREAYYKEVKKIRAL
ncbi:39S ribosomal protein L33, mitochondrial [Leptopilina heterotoma]|uniref:39S ribosomal protein L33, mitochondrial n=1 Tax=Leptopilina heterotoma TaxID=63436 RepID=UPI001CA87094|nr:39S ribosomal protein L33, mitochondrial [Leptopilina heterotoma]